MTGVCGRSELSFLECVWPPKIALDSKINRPQDAQRLTLALINNINSISNLIAFICVE